ncbi:MAG TPA: Ni/Fe hydrogenase subunit alpha [Lentisphaeria bacterium]|nr:MAG: NADP oxidoreductase [Lentisphaerae bacterium GWF2_38_69]HBM15592.1 Ni/Fe hydrogenase subunit alpha [Lentisphaeria bacterium]
MKKIVIEPVTRVEGHGKVTIILDDENKVKQARLHIVEFRGFERFIVGRPYWEVPVMVQRLCGICPVSHHLAAAKAMDYIVGVDKLTPTAEKIRRLMHYGQFFQSHALHFFHLCSPDILFGFDADVSIRNVVGVINKFPELATQAVLMRKFGQEIIKATAGKKIHGTGAIPGGVNKSLTVSERDAFLKEIDKIIEWSKASVNIIKDYTVKNLNELSKFGSFESNHLSIIREDGAMDIYNGGLRAIDSESNKIFDHVDNQKYFEFIAEEVRSWSYMKFPFIKLIGPEDGWYRVGPLARLNTCDFIPSNEAEKERKEFFSFFGNKICNESMAYHWARLIELLHSAEMIKELLNDTDITGHDLLLQGKRREEGVGIIEAPRGTLFHHYKVDENDLVTMCNLIVSTTNNNSPMNEAVKQTANNFLNGKAEITEGLMNRVEAAIRAYDPCLSCATHALGSMPLVVELIDERGKILDKKIR